MKQRCVQYLKVKTCEKIAKGINDGKNIPTRTRGVIIQHVLDGSHHIATTKQETHAQ